MADTESPYKPEVSNFCVAFTRFIISWNALEDVAREIVNGWAEGMLMQGILNNMNALSVQDALKDLSNQLERGLYTLPEQQTQGRLIGHFEKGMDRLRIRRNFYVHAIRGMGFKPDDPATFHAQFYAIEGRGKMSFNEAKVTTAEMMELVRANSTFSQFGKDILKATKRPGRNAMLGREPRFSLSEISKPDLPKPLEKNKHYLGQERTR